MFGKKIKTLLIEDDPIFRHEVTDATSNILDLTYADSIQEAKAKIRLRCFDLVLLDKNLPDGVGIQLIPELKMSNPYCVIIVLTSDPTDETVIDALDLGASDYLVKTENIRREITGRILVARGRLSIEQRCKKAEFLASEFFTSEIIGKSKALKDIREEVRVFGASQVNVLVTGETGTGKELIAKALNLAHGDKSRPFITLNCGAIQENLVESELFGHERGAFTGATTDKVGKVELANGGDLFLDEIGELPVEAQAKLLRVLQDGEYFRVGSNQKRYSKFRIISATHRDLAARVSEGMFREDLLFRINGAEVYTTPLRDRPEDIPEIASHLLHKYGGARFELSKEAIDVLMNEMWPGNVRELKNRIERAYALASSSDRSIILAGDVAVPSKRKSDAATFRPGLTTQNFVLTPSGYESLLDSTEKDYLAYALRTFKGDVAATAARIGIPASSLYRKLRDFKIVGGRKVREVAGQ